eukprot:7386549-Prymnesium_polylepis.3
MAQYLHGEEAFGFPMTATTVPATGTFSEFCEIDEEGLKTYRDTSGGCGCKTGCNTMRCSKCLAAGRPCTWRCACKGKCTNAPKQKLPKPVGISSTDLETLPLDEIVKRLEWSDVEMWAAKHRVFTHYVTQFVLCSPANEKDCWYCRRFGSRRLPAELHGRPLPFHNTV